MGLYLLIYILKIQKQSSQTVKNSLNFFLLLFLEYRFETIETEESPTCNLLNNDGIYDIFNLPPRYINGNSTYSILFHRNNGIL